MQRRDADFRGTRWSVFPGYSKMFDARIIRRPGGFSHEHGEKYRYYDTGLNGSDYRNVGAESAVDRNTQGA